MHFVFMDESGYTPNWKSGIEHQPYYISSAVCIPSGTIPELYDFLRKEIEQLKIPDQSTPLGLGFEVKAKDIARGGRWWGENNEKRNIVRDLFLSSPASFGGTAFVSVIDKKAHLDKYVSPADPYFLAMTFVLERVELFLSSISEFAYCIYDQNKRLEPDVQDHSTYLIREGSHLMYLSRFLDALIIKSFKLSHLIELSSGVSKNSIGLQIADYFATMTYHFYMDNKPSPCGWWDLLTSSLHTYEGKLSGVGLKEFP